MKKNTPLPCESSQTFYTVVDNQSEVEVTVTQGEDTEPEYVNTITTTKFELPSDRPANCPIKVTYRYDTNQRMHCKFEDLESHNVLEVDFCLDKNGKISDSDVKQKAGELAAFKVE